MLEPLCRQSSATLDILHAEDGPPITERTLGLGPKFLCGTNPAPNVWRYRTCLVRAP
jgi:hypothetical protein